MTDHTVQMRTSTDGGRNWGQWRNFILGLLGPYVDRALFRRLGIARDLVVEFKDTSAYSADVIAASVDLE